MGNSHKVVKYDGNKDSKSQVGKASNPTRANRRAADARAGRTVGSSDDYRVDKTGK